MKKENKKALNQDNYGDIRLIIKRKKENTPHDCQENFKLQFYSSNRIKGKQK